jgi:hypothetical protein
MLTQVEIAFYKPNGDPIANAPVSIQLTGASFDTPEEDAGDTGIYMPGEITAVTGVNGKVIVSLFPAGKPYAVNCVNPDGEGAINYKIYVPEVEDPDFVVRMQDIIDPAQLLPPTFDIQAIRVITKLRGEVVAAKAAADAIFAQIMSTSVDASAAHFDALDADVDALQASMTSALAVLTGLVNPVHTNMVYTGNDLTSEKINGVDYVYTYLTPGGKLATKVTGGKTYTYNWSGETFTGMTVSP